MINAKERRSLDVITAFKCEAIDTTQLYTFNENQIT